MNADRGECGTGYPPRRTPPSVEVRVEKDPLIRWLVLLNNNEISRLYRDVLAAVPALRPGIVTQRMGGCYSRQLGLDRRSDGLKRANDVVDPARRARAIVAAVKNYDDPAVIAEHSEDLGEAMVGINESEIEVLMSERGL